MPGKRILVIDDSNTNLVLLESLLEKNGYDVCSALSAMDGFECLKEKKPDLIYLDFLMPEIDGLEFMDLLNKNSDWRDIPVVIISAISDADVINRSKEKGVIEYITKPIDINRIVNLTREIISD